MPGWHPRLPAAWPQWAARAWPPLLFLAAFGLLWRYLPARPLVTVVHPDGPAFPSFTPDGKRLLGQSFQDKPWTGRIRVWELPIGRDVTGPLAEYRLSGFASPLPHGELLLVTCDEVGSKRYALRLLELATGRERLRLAGEGFCLYCASADGRKLAWAAGNSADSTIEIWDLDSCRREARFPHGGPTFLSMEGGLLVTLAGQSFSGAGEKWTLWDVVSGQERGHGPGCGGLYTQVRLSPDGRTLAIDCYGPAVGGLTLWDTRTGREKFTLPQAYRFDFLLGGRVVAATGLTKSFANRVRCWDVATGRELDAIPLKVSAGDFMCASVRASPDGRRLAVEVGSEVPGWEFALPLPQRPVLWRQEKQQLSEIKVFDATSGRELATLPGSRMERYTFSPDGNLLAVAREDGRIDVWQVPPRKPIWLAAGFAGLLTGAALLLRRWWRKRGTAAKRAGANESPPPHKERLLSP